MRKKRLSWTDPLNHKKRAQTTFLQDFSFGPRLQCTFLLCYFSTTFLSQVELFVEMSSPSLKSTAKYTSFPVIWVSISFINDPRFLLIFSHNCASNLWLMRFFMKQKQYHSSTGVERNFEMKSYLGLSHSPPGLLSNTFCRRRWWEREMTNVKEEEDRAIHIYKSPQNFNIYFGNHSISSFTTEY